MPAGDVVVEGGNGLQDMHAVGLQLQMNAL